MLQQLQSPFTFTAPEPTTQTNSTNLLLPTPTFSEKSSDSTIYNLQTPISPILQNQTIIGQKLCMLQSKISLMDDCVLKQEICQLVQDLQNGEEANNLPQKAFDEFIIQTPPSSFEDCAMKTPPRSTSIEDYSYQTPRDKIIDYENCQPPAPPKQLIFNHHQPSLNFHQSNIPNVTFSEEDIMSNAITFNQHFLDWDSFDFDAEELSF
ncbi:hypothetical protein JA1_004875 [Spathaspora sp. JA1]|nr:hypothetical protein JA1_004875 [Spathaspora sp. JA1]